MFCFKRNKNKSQNRLMNLNIGIVKENFAIVPNEDVSKWQSRGFEVVKKYPIYRYIPNKKEKIMLGIPVTISQFGIERLYHSTIVGVSTCDGTYGMGGPGFFKLRLKTQSDGIMNLSFCMWFAGSSILLDDRIIESHPDYYEIYNPYIQFSEEDETLYSKTTEEFNKILLGCRIERITLLEEECTLHLIDTKQTVHTTWTTRYSEKFPPKKGTGRRMNAFEASSINDIILISHDGSYLVV